MYSFVIFAVIEMVMTHCPANWTVNENQMARNSSQAMGLNKSRCNENIYKHKN